MKYCWLLGLTFLWVRPANGAQRGGERNLPIEVQVEVSEVDNSKASSLGVGWIDSLTTTENSNEGFFKLGAFDRATRVQADLHFLMKEGAAQLLANPNLVTDSGTTASFHVGGEIPYITQSSLGVANVQFKPYGVILELKPLLESDSRIQLKIKAAVSAPDNSNGVGLSGQIVPALLAREVTSNVTIEAGTTMTLAGLVQSHKEEMVHGVPVLRRIPLLGALFRWRRTNYRRTTIIVFVTPRVAKVN